MSELLPHNMLSSANTLNLDLSFVFPCLNEEKTLGHCIQQVSESLSKSGINFEIVVADNGSSDRSKEIALSMGCRVVEITERGYGAALRGGIEAGQGEYVMFADSDSTYLYSDAAQLYKTAKEQQADMSIASRMTGRIEPGAMPPLHRWLGTPVLTQLINLLFNGHLSDCNSGFRCLRKAAFKSWGIRSNGMEFASELLIKALKAKAIIVEISSGLRCGPPGRVAHLRTWRDGMRHLLFIFSEKPRLFELVGGIALVTSTFLQTTAFMTGPMSLLGKFHIFDVHTQAILLLAGILGTQLFLFSCMLYLQTNDKPLDLTRKLINLDEGILFFVLLSLMSVMGLVIVFVAFKWSMQGFSNLNLAHDLLFWIHALAVGILSAFGLLGLHVLKKAEK